MKLAVKAIAFDIDGTLYSDWSLYIRIIPHVLKHLSFFRVYGRVRKKLHETAPLSDFYEYQARLLAENMRIETAKARKLIDSIIYKGLAPYFLRIKPLAHTKETIQSFKDAGYKIAILSDFPPEQKGDVWGIVPLCDAVLGSEEIGALKPSKYVFGALCEALGVDAGEILYVGNSVRSDIRGARDAGMRTAYRMPFWRRILGKKLAIADISFKNYRQLQKIVLQ